MKFWTAHLRPGSASVLVREAFSWGAFLFGPLWLLVHRAWVPAVMALAVGVGIVRLAQDSLVPVLFAVYALVIGFYGNDFRRFGLERRGFALVHVLAARNEEAALARLLAARPELAGDIAGEIPVTRIAGSGMPGGLPA